MQRQYMDIKGVLIEKTNSVSAGIKYFHIWTISPHQCLLVEWLHRN